MKKITKVLIACLMVLLCTGTAAAQFKFGIKAGVNVNKMSLNKHVFDADNGCGFTGGLMAEFTVPVIGICLDASVMYTRMNTQFETPSGSTEDVSGNLDGKIGKNFLEIPINLKYKFGLPVVGSFLKPYLFTGPSFAIKLDKNSLDAIRTKSCQTAWNIGLGVELVNHLQVSAGYGFGMNNVFKKVGGINPDEIKAKNNYWTITAAYLF
ncbi:MAG: porin family protein [Prevotella sp.]|nr:porin family protein [Bacteroides sp.]MCM1366577.1 porin family protein [Prevotella sp.]MCM1437246.1 porin family protein [Prevotella sp.]